jgi:hypothetical protein
LAECLFEVLRLAKSAGLPVLCLSSLSGTGVAHDTEAASLLSFFAIRFASTGGRPTSRSSLFATDARSDMIAVSSAEQPPSSDETLVSRADPVTALLFAVIVRVGLFLIVRS